MTKEDFLDGKVLLFDKPLHKTSFNIVSDVRYLIKKKFDVRKIKVGHAGTLDPLATGMLIICTGKFTKQINEYQGQEKEYTGIIRLGATTPSYDLETEVDQTFPTEHITKELIKETTKQFTGEILQSPPIFSALKKDGEPLYKKARRGETVEVPKRLVTINSFEIEKIEMPDVHFRVVCSKGTYIRSLAYDFGKALNSGGHLTKLCRTRIGEFKLEDAISIDDFKAQIGWLT